MNVFPDFGAVGGASGLPQAIGALLTIILIAAVLMLLICAVTWAIASATGNAHLVQKARAGVFCALAAAALAGAEVAWMNALLRIGGTF
ncbi:MAG: hypothetical protein JSS74_12525 [Actinobacteria bacterium]|nr:hypothetical protein [Actinomycetota bacterium]